MFSFSWFLSPFCRHGDVRPRPVRHAVFQKAMGVGQFTKPSPPSPDSITGNLLKTSETCFMLIYTGRSGRLPPANAPWEQTQTKLIPARAIIFGLDQSLLFCCLFWCCLVDGSGVLSLVLLCGLLWALSRKSPSFGLC